MNLLLDQIVIFLIAIVIDLSIGDPPERIEKFYPIVWISRLMYFFDRLTKRGDARRERILGAVYAMFITSVFALPCLMLLYLNSDVLYIVFGAIIFKMSFTIKGLERFGLNAMVTENLADKREAVRKIVSREVAALDMKHLDSATVESVAENLTDSVIAPFFYFALFGVFGAMVYRVINTLDAVVGYRNKRYEHFGWFSAKTDDVLNYIPERIATVLILVAGKSRLRDVLITKNVRVHLTIVAMSAALRVNLEKLGHYSVGDAGFEDASAKHIAASINIVKRSTFILALGYIAVMAIVCFVWV
ncbi:Cobalamin biosynthesis protein CbiB [ANME-1 cluster archaeon GoMg2]|nr:Cobalamin biosynthesis protein CbiB [ANME-1 cluster archaeon GoMg2]